MAKRHFRAGVVIVVRRDDGRVLAFERVDAPGQWQLPQGGVESREDPLDAAWRELEEETGLTSADTELVTAREEWIAYEWPPQVIGEGDRLGQVQRWFEFRLVDEATEPTPDGREFGAWRWVDTDWLIGQIVDWRRGAYERGLLDGAPAIDDPVTGDDLFTEAAETRLRTQAPLAARLRPRSIDDIVGQDQLVGAGRPLRRLVEQDRLSSVLLWGPPGTGKTTLALAVAGSTARAFEQLSAVNAGVKDVRDVIERARRRLGERGQGTILFLDEIHRFTKAQQDALLPAVEDGTLVLIGATTENPFFEVNPPLRSRSTLFRLDPLDADALRTLAERGLDALGTAAAAEAVDLIVDRAAGDGRQVLTSVEVAAALADPAPIDLEHAQAALSTSALRYGRDDHYDVISAFIKSMRGSDPDATVYWLARMLESGEDPRFVARRMVILASEDIGMADPQSLVVATAAAHALELVGLPEAQLNLAQAAIHLALAPKSNSTATAIWTARGDVAGGAVGEVPPHLRDTSYRGAASLGHGRGYDYPHDHEGGWVDQQYLPDSLRGRRWYEPSRHGHEQEVAERMERRRDRGRS